MDQEVYLPISYNGPVYYYALLAKFSQSIFEQHENFPKQTIRNRCEILGANGPVFLSVPVIRGRTHKVNIRDLKISYEIKWQKQHFRSIESAYRNSPFYEYYIDNLKQIYTQKYNFLWDMNIENMTKILEAIDLELDIIYTEEFYTKLTTGLDFRYKEFPKNNERINSIFPPYRQVFSDIHGFVPNLSILDLLFNEGPGTLDYLQKCFVDFI